MTKVVFLDIKPFEEEYIKKHMPDNLECEMYSQRLEDIDKDKLKDIEIISIFTSSSANEESLKKLTSLKMLNTRSTGVDHINLDYCKKNKIITTNVPAYGQQAVSEYAFALMGNLIRKITLSYNDMKSGNFDPNRYIGTTLSDKTLGIIGTGNIGCHTAQIANGYGMKILAFDPKPKQELIEKYNLNYVSIEELYKNSDIITLHCPYTEKNHHMIDSEAINKMKQGVCIINTARGELIDTKALLEGLKSRKILGAALDVLESEKIITKKEKYTLETDQINKQDLANTLINSELIDMENVIVTPHCAYETVEAVHEILDVTIKNIKGYLNQEIINKAA